MTECSSVLSDVMSVAATVLLQQNAKIWIK